MYARFVKQQAVGIAFVDVASSVRPQTSGASGGGLLLFLGLASNLLLVPSVLFGLDGLPRSQLRRIVAAGNGPDDPIDLPVRHEELVGHHTQRMTLVLATRVSLPVNLENKRCRGLS